MIFDLRPIDRHFADFICQESSVTDGTLWLVAALVSHATGQGDICLDLDEITGREIVLDGKSVLVPAKELVVATLKEAPTVTGPGGFCPLVLDAAGRLYLHRYWKYEDDLAQAIIHTSTGIEPVCEDTLQAGLSRLFPHTDDTETDWQAVAALAAVQKRFCCISGGPGTGKTSTVVKILALLLEQYPGTLLRIALAAPTGKAAARLKESIIRLKENLSCDERIKLQIPSDVSTIHRLLGTISGSVRFRFSAKNPLPHDLIIIDEASMVDLPLMSKLVTALKPDARLILLGDRDQLASVEAGAVLGDLCGSGRTEPFSDRFCALVARMTGAKIPDSELIVPLSDTLVVLKKNYRFQAASQIGRLADCVNRGDGTGAMAILSDQANAGVTWHDLPAPGLLKRSLGQDVIEGYRPYLAASTIEEALALFDSFRLLCALREGPYGVAGVTLLIEELLAEHGLIDPRSRWYKGRPILITANDYSMKLFNGDIGIVFPDAETEGSLRVFFRDSEGGIRKVSPLRLPEHQTVYAMTIHKSQGSEFEKVLLLLPDQDTAALTRELLYTGITRAKRDVAIWGNTATFMTAAFKKIGRKSGLRDALWVPQIIET